MTSTPDREPTLSDIAQQLRELRVELDGLTSDVEASNNRFEKWDGRLWGLTLGLIGKAWTAIFAASAVVITRLLAGQ